MRDGANVPIVLDVSATMSWLVDDERDRLAIEMAETILNEGAIVPVLWRWELRNALLVAERRGRISATIVQELLSDVAGMPIRIDLRGSEMYDESDLTLARRYSLSIYDAAYLDLASRSGFPLMTRDLQLANAAKDLALRWQPS